MFHPQWLLRPVIAGSAACLVASAAAQDAVVREFPIGTAAATVGIAPAC